MSSLLLNDPARICALVVGVETYDGGEIPHLAGCAAASREFRDWLTDHGVAEEQILMHVSPPIDDEKPPKYQTIIQSLQGLKANDGVKARDLVIYWASHGYSTAREERCVYFADSFPQLQTLHVGKFLEWLSSRDFGFETVFAVFDCCANSVEEEFQLAPIQLTGPDPRDRIGQVYLHFACGIGETAGYGASGGNFSAIFLREVRDRPWPLNLEEFDRSLNGKYQALANKDQRPIRIYSQTPERSRKMDFEPKSTTRPPIDSWWAWFRGLFPGYGKKYLNYVAADRSIDIRGLTSRGPFDLELDRIYVEPLLKPVPPQQVSSNPVRRVAQTEGLQDIWYYLTAGSFARHCLVVWGGPGTGKTTILRQLALSLAGRHRQRRPHVLPVLLSLRHDIQGNTNRSLPQVIADRMDEMGVAPPPRWFQRRLEKGHCLIMLDALDEIGSEEGRRAVADWVSRQIRIYPDARFILTSRPYGILENAPVSVAFLEIQPFTREQVRTFVQNWYIAVESANQGSENKRVRETAAARAAVLLDELRASPTLAELAVNPLMLTMLTEVHQCNGSTPVRRTELYAEICRVFLGRRAKALNLPAPLNEDQSQAVLESIAWHMMCNSDREIERQSAVGIIKPVLLNLNLQVSANLFLRDSHERGGLFLEIAADQHKTAANRYTFAHLSLQEYFAALCAHRAGHAPELLSHLRDHWWRQTLLFFSAVGNASAVIGACLSEDDPSIENLTLAVQCMEEAPHVDQQLRDRIEAIRWIDDPSAERRRIAAQVRLAYRLSRLRMQDGKYIDSSLVTKGEYQLFIDDCREKGASCAPDHWHTPNFQLGEGLQPVVGVRPDDAQAFCRWVESSHTELWMFRLPGEGEIEIPGHWVQSQSGFDCHPPAHAKTITPTQLRLRFKSDLQRAQNFKFDSFAHGTDIAACQAMLLAVLETLDLSIRYVAEFIALIAEEWDFDGTPDLGNAVRAVMRLYLELEDAWDPDLIRAAFSTYPGFDDTAGGFSLDDAIPACLDLDSAFHFLDDGTELPGYRALQADIDLEKFAVRLARQMESGLLKAWERVLKPRTPLVPDNGADPEEVADVLRWNLRLRTLISAGLLQGRGPSDTREPARFEHHRRLYVALAILEERIKGSSQAYEGIAIVKEMTRP
jgi:hypothetical protein